MRPFNEQFTLRGVITGLIGCVIITASSVYIALKLGALPWPIFFVVLLALFVLKALGGRGGGRGRAGDSDGGAGGRKGGRGRKGKGGRRRATNINEVNVSASIMSAGAMVAGGLAFTIPGIYILYGDIDVGLHTIILCALGGVTIGSIGTALFRKRFIVDSVLPFPIGVGATQTLRAGDEGGRKAALLFGSLGLAGVFTIVRDGLGLLPKMLFGKVDIPGVSFGIYCSPMALAMGFMIGPLAALVWVLGGVAGNFGIVTAGTAAGLWSFETALDIRMSLGIGLMIGCGLGIIVKEVLPRLKTLAGPLLGRTDGGRAVRNGGGGSADAGQPAGLDGGGAVAARSDGGATTAMEAAAGRSGSGTTAAQGRTAIVSLRWAPFALAAVVLVLAFVAGLGLVPTLLLVALVWVVVTMAAQCTGQAGMNPMEVFGVIVLLVIALVTATGGVEAFLVAATATVACGFVGDLMNDFKAGQLLETDPKAQWIGVTIGGVLGALIGAGIIALFVSAYGAQSFGPNGEFIAAQATAVASMVGGIPHLPAFLIGAAIGVILYLLGAPAITLGLGVYLPFYLSLTVAVGAAVRFFIGLVAPNWIKKEDGLVIASGLLGGESIIGVTFALIAVIMGVTAL